MKTSADELLPNRSELEIAETKAHCLESQVGTLLSEINAYMETARDLDVECNRLKDALETRCDYYQNLTLRQHAEHQDLIKKMEALHNENKGLAAQNARLREKLEHFLFLEDGMDESTRPEVVANARAVLSETAGHSLAYIEAAAIDRMCGQWKSEAENLPSQHECRSNGSSTYNWQMYYSRTGFAYADRIRQSAIQPGEE